MAKPELYFAQSVVEGIQQRAVQEYRKQLFRKVARAGLVTALVGTILTGATVSIRNHVLTGIKSASASEDVNRTFTDNGHTYKWEKRHFAREGLEYAVSHSAHVPIPKLSDSNLVYLTEQKNDLVGKNIDVLAEGNYWLPVPARR